MSYTSIYNDAAKGAFSSPAHDWDPDTDLFADQTSVLQEGALNQGTQREKFWRERSLPGGNAAAIATAQRDNATRLAQTSTNSLLSQISQTNALIATLRVELNKIDSQIEAYDQKIAGKWEDYREIIAAEHPENLHEWDERFEASKVAEESLAAKDKEILESDMKLADGVEVQKARSVVRNAYQPSQASDLAREVLGEENSADKVILQDENGTIWVCNEDGTKIGEVDPLSDSLLALQAKGGIETIEDYKDARQTIEEKAGQKGLRDENERRDLHQEARIAKDNLNDLRKSLEEENAELAKLGDDIDNDIAEKDILLEKKNALIIEITEQEQKLDSLRAEMKALEDAGYSRENGSAAEKYAPEQNGGISSQNSFQSSAYQPRLSTIESIQSNLNDLGMYSNTGIDQVDGIWGRQTSDAMAKFLVEVQEDPTYEGSRPDGLYGPMTQRALEKQIEELKAVDPEKAEAYQSLKGNLDDMYSKGQLNNLYARPADWQKHLDTNAPNTPTNNVQPT